MPIFLKVLLTLQIDDALLWDKHPSEQNAQDIAHLLIREKVRQSLLDNSGTTIGTTADSDQDHLGAVTLLDFLPCFQLSMEVPYYCGTHRRSLNFPHWISQSKVYGSKYTSRYMKSRKVLRVRQLTHSTNIRRKKTEFN